MMISFILRVGDWLLKLRALMSRLFILLAWFTVMGFSAYLIWHIGRWHGRTEIKEIHRRLAVIEAQKNFVKQNQREIKKDLGLLVD